MNYPQRRPQVAPELRAQWKRDAETAKARAAESYEIHQKDGPCDCEACRAYLESLL